MTSDSDVERDQCSSYPDPPARLGQQQERQEDRYQAAVEPGDQEESVVVFVRPAEGGEEEGAQGLAGAGVGGEEEGEVDGGEGGDGEEGGEDCDVTPPDTEVQPDTVMVPPYDWDTAHSAQSPLRLLSLTELSPQAPVREDHQPQSHHQHQVLPPRDQLGQVPEGSDTLDFIDVEEDGSGGVRAVKEELCLRSVLGNDPDTEPGQAGEEEEEGEEGRHYLETGEPEEARDEDQGQDLTKRHLDSSSFPGDPKSLLRNIQDLRDKVGLHASARHQTVHGLVQGNTVAAEGQ